MSEPPKVLFVGCGNMGRALLDGLLASGTLTPEQVTVADPAASAPDSVTLMRETPQRAFDLVVLAIKPQGFAAAATSLRATTEGALVLSILAGIDTATLAKALPQARVARVMANLAAAFGRSPVALYAGPGVAEADRTSLNDLAAAWGPVEWLADESLLHVVTALAGSGPGFVYRLLESLARAGAELGLEPKAAAAMALATVRGAAELAALSGDDFLTLADRVASPGGTTRAGLDVLETGNSADKLLAATLRAARDRSVSLAEG